MLPEADVAAIEQFCAERVSPDLHDQLRVEAEVGTTQVTIVERRPPWDPAVGPDWSSTPVARLRYTASRGTWTLQCMGSDLRWQRYEGLGPATDVHGPLREIERDPTGMFWG